MSSHYETKKPLSPELIEKIVKRSVPSLIYCYCRLDVVFVVILPVGMSMSGCSTFVNCSLPSLTLKCTPIRVSNTFIALDIV